VFQLDRLGVFGVWIEGIYLRTGVGSAKARGAEG
jgi:hypothetical protein